jgi:hypothetical protein
MQGAMINWGLSQAHGEQPVRDRKGEKNRVVGRHVAKTELTQRL